MRTEQEIRDTRTRFENLSKEYYADMVQEFLQGRDCDEIKQRIVSLGGITQILSWVLCEQSDLMEMMGKEEGE